MPADHTQHLVEHARPHHHQTLQRAQQVLTELADSGEQVTVTLLADRAEVSRSWIYTQPALRDQIRQLQRHRASAGFVQDAATRATDDSLRQRLALAHERINQLRGENQQLRDALAHAHGQLRAARLSTGDRYSKTLVHNTKYLFNAILEDQSRDNRRYDRPPRPPRRSPRPQRRQLPAQGPRPRPRARSHHRRIRSTNRQGVNFQMSTGGQNSPAVDSVCGDDNDGAGNANLNVGRPPRMRGRQKAPGVLRGPHRKTPAPRITP